jgi:hypothetical protein
LFSTFSSAREPRSYADVMEAWRTSCPRLTVWEDAVDRGFAARKPVSGQSALVELTPAGHAFLLQNGRMSQVKSASRKSAGSKVLQSS